MSAITGGRSHDRLGVGVGVNLDPWIDPVEVVRD